MLKYDQRDLAIPKVLLMPDVVVRRDQDFETGLLGDVEQLAVPHFLPTPRPRLLHSMAGEETGKTSRRAVIEKHEHSGNCLAVTRGFIERTRHKSHEAVYLLAGDRELFD